MAAEDKKNDQKVADAPHEAEHQEHDPNRTRTPDERAQSERQNVGVEKDVPHTPNPTMKQHAENREGSGERLGPPKADPELPTRETAENRPLKQEKHEHQEHSTQDEPYAQMAPAHRTEDDEHEMAAVPVSPEVQSGLLVLALTNGLRMAVKVFDVLELNEMLDGTVNVVLVGRDTVMGPAMAAPLPGPVRTVNVVGPFDDVVKLFSNRYF